MSIEHLREAKFWIAIALIVAQAFVPAIAEWTHLSLLASTSITTGLAIAIGRLALGLPSKDEIATRRAEAIEVAADAHPIVPAPPPPPTT